MGSGRRIADEIPAAPRRLNATHWTFEVGGAGVYRGRHKWQLDSCGPGVWCVRAVSRLWHVLVARTTWGGGGPLLLPPGFASTASLSNSAATASEVPEAAPPPHLAEFLTELVGGQRLAAMEHALGEVGLRDVLAMWLREADHALLERLTSVPGPAGRLRRRKAFRIIASALEDCHPGVEKISACGNLKAFLPTRVRVALAYIPLRGGVLERLLRHGVGGWQSRWFDPAFSEFANTGDASRLLGVRELAPGILALPVFRRRMALALAADVRHFRRWARARRFPHVAADPYITVLDELGGEAFFNSLFLQRFVAPVVAALLPEARRDGPLDRAYAFVRHYDAETSPLGEEQQDGVHHDESAVTVNIALSSGRQFLGGNLTFCGVFGEDDYRRHVHTMDWSAMSPGFAVVHSGLRRHAAAPLMAGRRTNLVLWAISSRPRAIQSGAWETRLEPDPQCLSELYDADFQVHRHLLRARRGPGAAERSARAEL